MIAFGSEDCGQRHTRWAIDYVGLVVHDGPRTDAVMPLADRPPLSKSNAFSAERALNNGPGGLSTPLNAIPGELGL
jgi:hypothetical protein